MKELMEKEEELKRLKLELELARTRAKLDEEKRRRDTSAVSLFQLEQKQKEEMAQIRALQDRSKKTRPSPSEDSATETSIQESDSKEDIGNIFSGEDMDYRQAVPSVHQSPAQQRWSKFKENHPDDFTLERDRRKSADEVRRTSLAAAGVSGPRHQDFDRDLQDVDFRRKRGGLPQAPLLPAPGRKPELKDDIPEALSLENQQDIMMNAVREVQAGRMTHEEHQKLLQQLGRVYDMQRQRQSRTRDKGLGKTYQEERGHEILKAEMLTFVTALGQTLTDQNRG
nr:hypothetical protein BaRGS_022030 [Batillaria attramentaria]